MIISKQLKITEKNEDNYGGYIVLKCFKTNIFGGLNYFGIVSGNLGLGENLMLSVM